jgi:glycosyltransferase involved in cell wall biosynthesis
VKVLVVDEEVPFPLNTGKRIRTWNLLRRLKDRHEITYLSWGKGEAPVDGDGVRFVNLGQELPAMKGPGFYASLLTNLLSPLPYSVQRHAADAMREAVRTLVAKEMFDLIHCEWTPYVEAVRDVMHDCPSVLSAHNVEARIWERYLKTETNPFKKEYIRIQHRKFDRFEREAARACAHVVAVSHKDASVFSSYGCPKVSVVPNGVDEAYFYVRKDPVQERSMVFTGSMDWRPNQDGIAYFLNDIFPLIQKSLPDVTFTIVGRNPPAWLTELGKTLKGVLVTGTVDDVRPYIAGSTLYIVPLRVGGGSRLKILEALAMNKVVLSTTIGAEGLHLENGQHLLLRDDDQAFADAAVEALRAPERFDSLACQGRERVMELYTWDRIATALDDVWIATA